MIAPTRLAVRAGVSLLTRRTAFRLRRASVDLHGQERSFRQLIAQMSRCSDGQDQGLHRGMTYTRFRERVPLRSYEDFLPLIDMMKEGQSNILWPGQCQHFAVSSGTTAGRTKYLPVTPAMFAHFRQAGLDSLLFYTSRMSNSGVFSGRHLFLGGSTALTPQVAPNGYTAQCGDLSGLTALNLPGWVESHLYEPGREIALIADWPTKLRAIAERTRNQDIRLLAGIPSWLLVLAETLLQSGAQEANTPATLRDLWPNLECLVHGGVPVGPYASTLAQVAGRGVNFHEVYPASEGFIAAQDSQPGNGLRLLARHGIHYEFLPLRDYDPSRLADLGGRTVPLEGVRAGIDYALVMTTPAGLSRYLIGDVVRFVSTDPLRLVYVGRTRLQLSAFGEHVIEHELTESISAAARRHEVAIAHFHVAPLFVDPAAGRNRGRHEWWVELRQGQTAPAADAFATDLDAQLRSRNEDYAAKRDGGGLDGPLVRFVRPRLFEDWMRRTGKWGGQNKLPRCRSDRNLADALELI